MASSSFKKMIDERNKYSEEKLISHFQESRSNQFGTDEEKLVLTGHITIDRDFLHRPQFLFLNVIFEGNVTFKDIHFGKGFVFELCEFKGELRFKNCSSDEEELGILFLRKASLGLTRCKIHGNLSLINCDLKNGFLFHGFENEPSSARSLKIENGKSSGLISIENSSFEESVGIFNTEIFGNGLRFEEVKIGGLLRISPSKCKDISFLGRSSVYKDGLYILGQELDSLTFNYGEFLGEIRIENTAIDEHLSLFGSTFLDSFFIGASGSQNAQEFKNLEITIQDSQFKNGFIFSGENSPTKKLNLNFSEKSSGVLDFRNSIFKEVILKGNNFNNSIFLRDCSFEQLTFSHFFNKALVSVNNNSLKGNEINPKEFLIENSNLGNTEFYDFDFSIYTIIRIIDSRLDNIFVNGVEWFKPDQLQVDESETDPKKILSQKREIYRQLKLAAEKQSDRITSLKFKAKEIEIHNALLGKEKFFSKKWFKQIGDVIAICLGATNNHGQNWVLPFILLLGVTLFPFYPLIFMAADPDISFWCLECNFISLKTFGEKFWNYGSAWPSLFNPARRINDLFPDGKNSFALGFWDGLHRIILAFFIFQIVSAFRKFVK